MPKKREKKVMCSIVLHVTSEGKPTKHTVAHVSARNVGKALAKAKDSSLAQLRARV